MGAGNDAEDGAPRGLPVKDKLQDGTASAAVWTLTGPGVRDRVRESRGAVRNVRDAAGLVRKNAMEDLGLEDQ